MSQLEEHEATEEDKREMAGLALAAVRLAVEASSADNATDGLLIAVAMVQALAGGAAVTDDEVMRRYRYLKVHVADKFAAREFG